MIWHGQIGGGHLREFGLKLAQALRLADPLAAATKRGRSHAGHECQRPRRPHGRQPVAPRDVVLSLRVLSGGRSFL